MEFDVHISKDEVANLEDLLKHYFLQRSSSNPSIKKDRQLQNKVIKTQSGLMLDFFKNTKDICQSEIFNEIKQLYENYSVYLDSDGPEFFEGLKTNFPSRIFELVIAHLSDQSGYTLKKTKPNLLEKKGQHKAKPDLWIDDFFIECRSNNSSFLDDWDKSLPYFDKYVEIIKYILAIRASKNYEHPCVPIAQVWDGLSKQEIGWMAGKLDLSPNKIDLVLNTLNEWVLLNHHIRCYFEHLIPKELQTKLNEINIKRTDSRKIDNSFISKRIVESLIDKLQQNYFKENYGIIALSTAFLIPGLQLSVTETHALLDYFKKYYENIVIEVISKKKAKEKQIITKGLRNLIGIILDTNWYNWFSPTLQKHGLAHFSNSQQNNFFYLMYDEKNLNYHKIIPFKKTIQYHQSLNFTPKILDELSKHEQLDAAEEAL